MNLERLGVEEFIIIKTTPFLGWCIDLSQSQEFFRLFKEIDKLI